MPNLSSLLKQEISRISRKVIKAATAPIHSSTISLKKTITDLKKRIVDLEAGNKKLVAKEAVDINPEARITAKSIKALRLKLGLSQVDFAKLIGVSSNSVNLMEHKEGRIKVRSKTLGSIMQVRGMGKREAKKRLNEIASNAQGGTII